MQRIAVWIAVLTILASGCQKDYIGQAEIRANIEESELFLRSVEKLTDVQIHDIFAPPVAARVYAYPCIAAYESMVPAYAFPPEVPVKGPFTFIAHPGFATRILAHMLDSLVRVSRRVN